MRHNWDLSNSSYYEISIKKEDTKTLLIAEMNFLCVSCLEDKFHPPYFFLAISFYLFRTSFIFFNTWAIWLRNLDIRKFCSYIPYRHLWFLAWGCNKIIKKHLKLFSLICVKYLNNFFLFNFIWVKIRLRLIILVRKFAIILK